jgi:NodT family efflux transporter outer membrane factor (OMF) lipoprotein
MALIPSRRALSWSACLTLAGCTLGPDYHRPGVATPGIWAAPAGDAANGVATAPVRADWWQSFQDPVLTGLVERLTARNIDLKLAAETIEQARAQRRVAGSQGLPQIGAQGGYMRNRVSRNGLVDLLAPAADGAGGQVPSGTPPLDFDLFNAAGSASWEIDLFGRIRRSVEAAGADVEAAQEARSAVALALVSELALDYLDLREAQAQDRLAHDTLAVATDRERLVAQRVQEGAGSRQELAGAQAETQSARAALPGLAAKQAALINAIGYLLAEEPQALKTVLTAPAAPTALPPSVPVGMPSDLILRRPDVREAEARLHAATARIGVARAAFYPSVTLFGFGGLQSLTGSDFFNWASRTYAVGPSVSLPIFQGGRLKGQMQLAQSQQRAAVLRFRATVLQAWRDVDDGVTAYVAARESRAEAAAMDGSRQQALAYAREQRLAGAVGDIDVIQARTAALASADMLVQSDARLRASLVGLYKALGGGWEPIVAAPPTPSTATEGGA